MNSNAELLVLQAHLLATSAALQGRQFAFARLTDLEKSEAALNIATGKPLVLLIINDGVTVHSELAITDHRPEGFLGEGSVLRATLPVLNWVPEGRFEVEHALHCIHSMSAYAAVWAASAIAATLNERERTRFEELWTAGAKVAVVVTMQGASARWEAALVDRAAPLFENCLLALDGPTDASNAPPGSIRIVNRRKLN